MMTIKIPYLSRALRSMAMLFIFAMSSYMLSPMCYGQKTTNIRDRVVVSQKGKRATDASSSKALQKRPVKKVSPKERISIPDTVYSLNSAKQHGWQIPVAIIPKENVGKMGNVLRFTAPLPNGKYSVMEAIDFRGELTPNIEISPYILKLSAASTDSTANSNWIDRLRTTCRVVCYPDPTGEYVVQERAYDRDGNIIFTYSTTPIGDNVFIGSYKDFYGLPAEMRNDPAYTYGTLVRITRDHWGNDSIIEYIDAKGKSKLNSDGVAKESFVRDEKGLTKFTISLDENGKMTRDNWGNCGVMQFYDDNGSASAFYFIDEESQVMRMPNIRETGYHDGVMGAIFKRDSIGRLIGEQFVDDKMKKDSNAYGASLVEMKLDDHGNVLEETVYGKDGNLAAKDNSGISISKFTYDECGRMTEARFFDKNRKPNPNRNYYSRAQRVYDKDGKEVVSRRYEVVDGVEALCYYDSIYSGGMYHRDNTGIRIDSLDDSGTLLRSTYLDLNGRPADSPDYAYYIKEYFAPKSYTETKIKADASLYINSGIAIRKVVNKGEGREEVMNYDADGNLMETYFREYDPKTNITLRQSDLSGLGRHSRSGGSAGVVYYSADVMYNQAQDRIVSLIGRDERGEADYIYTANGEIYYYQRPNKKWFNAMHDEDDNEIENQLRFKYKTPKVLSIEIIDTIADSKGFRDNDVVLSFGNYHNPLNVNGFEDDLMLRWARHNIFNAGTPRDMIVYRIDPTTLADTVLIIPNVTAPLSKQGIAVHMRYLTKRQTDYITDAVARFDSTHPAIGLSSKLSRKTYEDRDTMVVFSFSNPIRKNLKSSYFQNVFDPSLLLGVVNLENGKTWTYEQRPKDKDDILPDKCTSYNVIYFCTRDMQTIETYTYTPDDDIKENGESVDETNFTRLNALNKDLNAKMNEALATIPKVTNKTLSGVWVTDRANSFAGMELTDISLSMEFKGDAISICITGTMPIPLPDVENFSLSLVMEVRNESRYSIDGRSLCCISDGATTIAKISDLVFDGAEEVVTKYKDQLYNMIVTPEMNEALQNEAEGMFDGLRLWIDSLSKDSLTIKDGDTLITFSKAKGK